MKLTMKDQKSFQRLSGYPEDPEIMSEGEIREHLRYWRDTLDAVLDGKDDKTGAELDLELLGTFLESLESAEIEYTKPYREFEYGVRFEAYKRFTVVADSEEEADKIIESMMAEGFACNMADAEVAMVEGYAWDDGHTVFQAESTYNESLPVIGKNVNQVFR